MATNAIPNSPANGVFDTVADLQAASWIRNGSVVSVRTSKLDYYVEETQGAGGVPITGTSPQLYANPQQTTPGTGETNTASNIGDGEGLFAKKVASDLQFRSQVSQYGLESHLVDDTYYRGLNPFVADNVGAFVGGMTTTRSTTTSGTDKSGLLSKVIPDIPFYGMRGLSCFGGSTHLLKYSEDFSQSYWFKNQCSVSPSLVEAPGDFDNPPFDIIPNTNNVQHDIRCSIEIPDENYLSSSVYVKSKDGPINMGVRIYSGSSQITFNPKDGTVISQSGESFLVEKMAYGFYRIGLSNAATSGAFNFRIQPTLLDGTLSFAGDGLSGITVIGANVSQSPQVMPYTYTNGTTLVSNGDVHSLPSRGNLPSASSDFSMIFECDIPELSLPRAVFSVGGLKSVLWRDLTGNVKFRITDENGARNANFPESSGVSRFGIQRIGDQIKCFVNGTPGSPITVGNLDYDFNDLIRIGRAALSGPNEAPLNGELKIIKWVINGHLTDQQFSEIGGPDNVIL